MSTRLRSYIRQHHIGLLALFLVVSGGTAYAVDGSLPGQDTVGSADIINAEVFGADIHNATIESTDLKDNAAVKTQDVLNDNLTGADINESTLSGFARTSANADTSILPGIGNGLTLNPGLGAQVGITCNDGGTPGADPDDTVGIDTLNN